MDCYYMKIYYFKRIISLFAIYIAVGCTSSAIDPNPEPGTKPNKPLALNGPENQYYYFTAAQVQRKKGNLDKAILMLRKAIELDPETPYLRRELATVYLQNKEDDKAIAVLKEVLQKHPNDIKALIIYGGTKQVRKEDKDAIVAYEKILSLDPKQQRVYSLLGSLYIDAGDYARARGVFNRLIKNFPASYTGHYYLGRINAQQGHVKEAEKNFKKAIELVHERPEPRFELIQLMIIIAAFHGSSDVIEKSFNSMKTFCATIPTTSELPWKAVIIIISWARRKRPKEF